MITHILKSKMKATPVEAAIDVIRSARSVHEKNTQALHIIIASLIQIGKSWRAVVSVIPLPDVDEGSAEDSIVFGHLPGKYRDLYDEILPEVDHLNLIDNMSVWRNIKLYLLDIYFYQAANFGHLKRVTETGGGYFKETHKSNKTTDADPDLNLIMKPFGGASDDAVEPANGLYGLEYYASDDESPDEIDEKKRRYLARRQMIQGDKSKNSAKVKSLLVEIGYMLK